MRGLALLLLPLHLGLGVEGEETAEAQAPQKGHVMRMGHTILFSVLTVWSCLSLQHNPAYS